MAKAKPKILAPLLMFTFVFAAYAIQDSRTQEALPYHERVVSAILSATQRESLVQGSIKKVLMKNVPRRMMIGSTAPTCTYNECRGCRFNCRAEQVPVEGNDPINSAYHYRCVCHR